MKPSEEVHHIAVIFRRMKGDNEKLIALIGRIKKIAMAYLAETIPAGANLEHYNQDNQDYLCREIMTRQEYHRYRPAALILRTCNHVLTSGRIEEHHLQTILSSYGNMNAAAEAREAISEKDRRGGLKSAATRQAAASVKYSKLQGEAEKIWEKHPGLSKSVVAQRLAKKFGGNFHTYR